MGTSLLAILSGLMAAWAWGSGDFAGGMASKRASSLRVVFVSQLIGTALVVPLLIVLNEPSLSPAQMGLAALAGIAGATGLALLYGALATGQMSVVAPLVAAVAGTIPVVYGILTEGLPAPVQLVGFVVALVAVWVLSRPADGLPFRRKDALLPLLAGVMFSVFLILIAELGETAIITPIVVARVASISFFALLLLGGRGRGTPESGRFPYLLAAVAGLGDTAGNALYVLSAQLGRLDVATVTSALYPAATVVLARLFLDERLARRQVVGIGLAFVAILLIAL